MAAPQEYLEFALPADPISLAFIKLSRQDKLRAIELGMKFLRTGTQQLQLWNNEEWVAKLEKQREEHQKGDEDLRRQIREGQAREKRSIAEHQVAIDDMRKVLEVRIHGLYEQEVQTLREKVERKEHKLQITSKENQQLQRQAYLDSQQQLQQAEIRWNERMEKIRDQYEEKLAAKKEREETRIVHAQNPSLKGQDGEAFIRGQYNLRFPKADFEDTHKTRNRGDLIMKEGEFGMLIEIKNYTRNVPKVEIDKFYKDMGANHDIQCGVLLSLQSGICAKEDFQLEVIDGKPILFLHRIVQNIAHIELSVLLFKLILKTEGIDLSCKEIMERVKNSIPVVKRNWNKMRQKIQRFYKDIMECLSDQEGLVRSVFELLSLRY